MLIVIEGLDGSGKSTQVKAIRDYLVDERGVRLHYMHFPRFDAPVVGEIIASFLRGDYGPMESLHPQIVALLFAEDRRDAAVRIREWLDRGEVVLLDRYVYSNIAFQCAKLEREEGEKLAEWIIDTEYDKYALPKPDLNIFLDVPLCFIEDRLSDSRKGDDRSYLHGKRDIHEADMAFQRRVREVYLESCRRDRELIRVECSGADGEMLPAEEISALLKMEIDKLFGNRFL